MLRCAVPLVAGKAVARKVLVQRHHQPVTRHLGDDAGGSDAQAMHVRLGERPLRQIDLRQAHIVHQKRVHPSVQPAHGAGHRLPRGRHDAHFVYLGRGGPAHSHGPGHFQDARQKCLPPRRAQLLGVAHAGQQVEQVRTVEREDHRCRADRPGPRTTPRLVQAGHVGVAGGVQGRFLAEVRKQVGGHWVGWLVGWLVGWDGRRGRRARCGGCGKPPATCPTNRGRR